MPKIRFDLVYKKELIPKTYYIIYKANSVSNFTPGQFFSIGVEDKQYRSYSTVNYSLSAVKFLDDINLPDLGDDSRYATFMISTKPGGVASKYYDQAKVGSSLMAIGPNGKFRLTETNKDKVFIATGTGLAPFVGMIQEVFDRDQNANVSVYFGVWNKDSNFAKIFLDQFKKYKGFRFNLVVDDGKDLNISNNEYAGKVTEVIPANEPFLTKKEYYLCGHPGMVAAMAEVLNDKGVPFDQVIMEKFGK